MLIILLNSLSFIDGLVKTRFLSLSSDPSQLEVGKVLNKYMHPLVTRSLSWFGKWNKSRINLR